MRYSVRERALFALLALPDEQANKVVARFDAIANDPDSIPFFRFVDAAGREGRACEIGSLRLYFHVSRSGFVTFTDLRIGR